MPKSSCLRARFPIGTKYVVESQGPLVRRYVEFPDGRKILLAPRKASTCGCVDLRVVSIVPADDPDPAILPFVDNP